MVSVHFHQVPSLDTVQQRLQRDSRLISRGADFLFHTMLDHIVDTYFSAQNTMEKEVDAIEAEVFEDPDQDILKRMFPHPA